MSTDDHRGDISDDIQDISPKERAVGKTAIDGYPLKETAALLGHAPGTVSTLRSTMIEDGLMDSEGRTKDRTYSSKRSEFNPEVSDEEVFQEDLKVLTGSIFDDATNAEIGEELGLAAQSVSSRRQKLERHGLLSSEGRASAKEFFAGVKMVDRLNRKDKVNQGRPTPFVWEPEESRVLWDSEENDAETFDELEMLDRLAFRIDQELDMRYEMPELDSLDPAQRWMAPDSEVDESVPVSEVSSEAAKAYPEGFQEEASEERETLYDSVELLASMLPGGINIIGEDGGELAESIEERYSEEDEGSETPEKSSEPKVTPIFEQTRGAIITDPDNEDLRYAIEERYGSLIEGILEGEAPEALPGNMRFKDIFTDDQLVMYHVKRSDGITTQSDIAEEFDWEREKARDAVLEATGSYELKRVPDDGRFEVFIPGKREEGPEREDIEDGSSEVEDVEAPSERLISNGEGEDEQQTTLDGEMLERDDIEDDDVSRLVTLLEGNGGQMEGEDIMEFYESREEVMEAISKARENDVGVVWRKKGQGFNVFYEDYEEDPLEGLGGKALWEAMKNGREIPEEEIEPEDLAGTHYKKRHIDQSTKKKVEDTLEDYPSGEISVQEFVRDIEDDGTVKVRRVIAHLIGSEKIDMYGDTIEYESSGPEFFTDYNSDD